MELPLYVCGSPMWRPSCQLPSPSPQVLADTKELVTSRVMGAREAVASTVAGAKDSVASRVSGAVDATRDALLGSHVGQLVQSGLDTVLGCSEAWMDNHLPLTDAELGELPQGNCGAPMWHQSSGFVFSLLSLLLYLWSSPQCCGSLHMVPGNAVS